MTDPNFCEFAPQELSEVELRFRQHYLVGAIWLTLAELNFLHNLILSVVENNEPFAASREFLIVRPRLVSYARISLEIKLRVVHNCGRCDQVAPFDNYNRHSDAADDGYEFVRDERRQNSG